MSLPTNFHRPVIAGFVLLVATLLATVFVWRPVIAANILWSSAAGSAWLTARTGRAALFPLPLTLPSSERIRLGPVAQVSTSTIRRTPAPRRPDKGSRKSEPSKSLQHAPTQCLSATAVLLQAQPARFD